MFIHSSICGLVSCLHLSADGSSSAVRAHVQVSETLLSAVTLFVYTRRFREHFITRNRVKGTERKAPVSGAHPQARG